MPRSDPSDRAAEAILTRLRSSQALEVQSSDAYPLIQQELRAVFDQAEWTESEADELRLALVEALEDSDNVDELFVDDEMLKRYLSAALLDYFAVVGKHRGPGASRRNAPTRDAGSSQGGSLRSLADEGFVFPLFEGNRDDVDHDEAGPCTVCKAQAQVRFDGACYTCLRAGRARITHDSELGAVALGDAETGITGGVIAESSIDPRGTESVLDHLDPSVRRFKVSPPVIEELLRTPQYNNIHGESWLFCCGAPMVFLGQSAAEEVTPDEVAELLAPATVPDTDAFLEGVLDGQSNLFVFRCTRCKQRRAHHESV